MKALNTMLQKVPPLGKFFKKDKEKESRSWVRRQRQGKEKSFQASVWRSDIFLKGRTGLAQLQTGF